MYVPDDKLAGRQTNTSRRVAPRNVKVRHTKSHSGHVTSSNVISRHVTSRRVASNHALSKGRWTRTTHHEHVSTITSSNKARD